MSKRHHRSRHHRPPRPKPLPFDVCAFQPCAEPLAYAVSGPVVINGAATIGLAYVCAGHVDVSADELGQVAEAIVAPIEEAAELLAFLTDVAGEVLHHAS